MSGSLKLIEKDDAPSLLEHEFGTLLVRPENGKCLNIIASLAQGQLRETAGPSSVHLSKKPHSLPRIKDQARKPSGRPICRKRSFGSPPADDSIGAIRWRHAEPHSLES